MAAAKAAQGDIGYFLNRQLLGQHVAVAA